MSFVPSGQQYHLEAGAYRATVVEVGGGVRELYHGERAVLDPYAATAMADGARGTPLIPWPNRLGDGRYRFDGQDYQVPLDEIEKQNALHGFLRWRSWAAVEQSRDRVVMTTTLYPMQGYPFALDVRVEYRLTTAGLAVHTTSTNIGDTACPYGSGQHPYLSAGEGLVDDCQLELAAETRVLTSADRQLPVGTEPVTGTDFDFRLPRSIKGLEIDYAFTDLSRDSDGLAWTRLHGRDGHTAQLWVDGAYPLVELFTGDTLSPDKRRRGLGTEPMTCPPNALQTGQDVLRLEPGESTSAGWGAQLVPTQRP